MSKGRDRGQLLGPLDLTEYEQTTLEELLVLGRTTAPDLAEATNIPKNRIYGVLDELAEQGFVKVIPGRPKQYQPKPPQDLLDRAVENQRQEFEEYRHEIDEVREGFLDEFEPLFEQASEEITPTEELFYVVDVGVASERETRSLYHDATEEVYVITKSFEYLDSIKSALGATLKRGISVRVLFLNPDYLDRTNKEIQSEIVDTVRTDYPDIEIRFSEHPLPWRGTFVDPSMGYETGKAILLVEETDIPLSMRQAAVTENGSFVAGLKRYFDLIWEYEAFDE